MNPIITVDSVTKHFIQKAPWPRRSVRTIHALDDVSFQVERGEAMAIVGESGCGKSTVAKILMGMLEPTSGRIAIEGVRERKRNLASRRAIQMVLQNPWSALNRRKTLRHVLKQPLKVHGLTQTREETDRRILELLDQIGLDQSYLDRYPEMVSGGELQRVTLARALAVDPDILVLDEPTASLDVSVKASLVNLLNDLRRELQLTYVLITHEIDIARHLADTVAVMYLGEIVEYGPVEQVLTDPAHPYTRSLLDSALPPDPRTRRTLAPLRGEVPSALAPPPGCRFHTRCPLAIDVCKSEAPVFVDVGNEGSAACHLVEPPQSPEPPRERGLPAGDREDPLPDRTLLEMQRIRP